MQKRKVAYGNINPEDATRIFLRSALVEENLFPESEDEELDAVTAPESQAQLLASAAPSRKDVPLLINSWSTTGRSETKLKSGRPACVAMTSPIWMKRCSNSIRSTSRMSLPSTN